jgi:hypothetical protein
VRVARTGDADRTAQRGTSGAWIQFHATSNGLGILVDQRVLPPPPLVALTFRDVLDELEGPGGANRYLQTVADLSRGAVNILAAGREGRPV